jgi:outer membrane protein assembly factor BamB
MRAFLLAGAVAGLALAALPAAAAAHGGPGWTTDGYDLARTGYNPAETTIGAGNVASLQPAWSYDLGAVSDTQPIVVEDVPTASGPRDIAYVGTEHGQLDALDVDTGALVWSRDLGRVRTQCGDLPGGVFGVTGAPVADPLSGRLYAVGGKGALYALDLATGATVPGWPVTLTAHPKREHVWDGLDLVGGTVYAGVASYCDIPPYKGRLVAVDTATASISGTWYTLGVHGGSGGGIWGWGGASADPAASAIYVSTGNALAGDEATPYAEDVVRLDRSSLAVVAADHQPLVGGDVDFGSTPTLFQAPGCPPQLAVENKSGVLFIYDRDAIAAGPTARLQVASVHDDELDGMPAWSPVTDDLYVSDSSSSGRYRHGMLAFHVASDCSLQLAWQTTVGPSQSVVSTPTVANGVVYYGDGTGGRVRAFDATTGAQLWTSGSTFSGPLFAAPSVAAGTLLAVSWDHTLTAFRPG